MKKEIDIKLLAKCIALPLIVGAVSALLTSGSMKLFDMVEKPPLSPPGWLFPVAWTILYTLMGVASYLVLTSDAEKQEISKAISLYIYQLIVNFLWPTFFFSFRWFFFSFLWLILLWVLVLLTTIRFYRISKPAGYLMIPYLVWLTFAGYLNLGIWLLN